GHAVEMPMEARYLGVRRLAVFAKDEAQRLGNFGLIVAHRKPAFGWSKGGRGGWIEAPASSARVNLAAGQGDPISLAMQADVLDSDSIRSCFVHGDVSFASLPCRRAWPPRGRDGMRTVDRPGKGKTRPTAVLRAATAAGA